jgi:hypothetical protein
MRLAGEGRGGGAMRGIRFIIPGGITDLDPQILSSAAYSQRSTFHHATSSLPSTLFVADLYQKEERVLTW